jgi:predicted MPP superfamily phosphohydrolase
LAVSICRIVLAIWDNHDDLVENQRTASSETTPRDLMKKHLRLVAENDICRSTTESTANTVISNEIYEFVSRFESDTPLYEST